MNSNPDEHALKEPIIDPVEQAEADRLARLVDQLESGELAVEEAAHPFAPLMRLLLGFREFFRSDLATNTSRQGTLIEPPDSRSSLPDPFPGEYRFKKLLGRGGFGEVWLAEQVRVAGRFVAIKSIKLSTDPKKAESRLRSLCTDRDRLANLKNDYIVHIHDWRQKDDQAYLIMEYVPGGSLFDLIRRDGPLPWERAAHYIADIADAIVAAHAKGVIHCDIKPHNILFDPDLDRAKLTDFGVSLHVADEICPGGTLPYRPPEAFEANARPTVQFDVYGLAVTLFQLLTGELPFKTPSSNRVEFLREVSSGLSGDDPRCHDIPEPLERLIRAGLSADPGRRPTPGEFATQLRTDFIQLTADSCASPHRAERSDGKMQNVTVRLEVSRLTHHGYQRVAASHPTISTQRNMVKIPRSPDQLCLRTGDKVRIDVRASETGYVSVYNIGPTGDLNQLFPDDPVTVPTRPTIRAGHPMHVLDVEMQPPTGRERLFAIWTRQPVSFSIGQMQAVAQDGELPSAAATHTRNIVKVKKAMQHLRPEDCHVTVLELHHSP